MITKTQFARYCFDVRKIKATLPPEQTFEYIYNWMLSHEQKTLSHIFQLVGLWGNRNYDGEFKYPELEDIKFCDLPDESQLSYLDILEKL
jgi:hypothetical protein